MPVPSSYDYALIRVVPRVERGEFINAGVILSCPQRDFLDARVHLDRARLLALDPTVDVDLVECHLRGIPAVCAGSPEALQLSRLSARERFHWLCAPRSTIIQTSPVHSGRTDDPAATLERLVRTMVLPPAPRT